MAREEGEIQELGKKLAQNPDSMVFVQLADAYRRAGNLEQSVEVCLRGLERHPTYTTARVILGRNYFDLGKLDEAASEFHQIETADPENILAHRMLGQIALNKGQFADAISRQQKVLALDPDDSTAQDLLQQALQAKQGESASKQAPGSRGASSDEHAQALKVADIYIKKRALDKAAEVIQEILASDPNHGPSRQKMDEINALRSGGGVDKGAEAEAERKAKEDADHKAKEDAERKSKEDAERKAKEDAERKAKEDAERKAKEDADRKAKEDADRKAKEDADRKAKEDADRKAKEDADRKAKEDAERKAKEDADRKAKEDADRKAKEDAERKAKEDAERKAKEETRHSGRGSDKFTPEDILSVIAGSAEDLIENDATAAKPIKALGADPAASGLIQAFLQAQAIEASLLLDAKGKVLEYKVDGDPVLLGQVAGAVFQSAERAAKNVGLGGLKQVMISCEGNRQILFLGLAAGVLVAVTGKDTNVGQLRVAVHDLMKRA